VYYYIWGKWLVLKENRLIAYNMLKRNIIDNGFCTACGACEGACPVRAIQIKGEKVERLYDCSTIADLCPICYEICPHTEPLLLRSLEAVYNAPIRSEAVGYVRKILLAQSNDAKIREKSHDGAVVTTLLDFGVKNEIFDSAIVTQTDKDTPVKPKPSVALVPDDIYTAIGTKFFPSPVVRTYSEAVLNYEKKNIALVAVPCQSQALRKIDAWKHKISGKTKVLIGLFCFGTLSLDSFLAFVRKEYKVEPSEIKKMYVSSSLVLDTKKGPIRMPLSKFKKHILPCCKTCIDYTSELADISVGSAYPLRDWSVVIIRTKAGEDFFNDAVQKGIINVRNIEQEPEVFEGMIVAALNKRNSGLIEANKLEQTHSYVPVRLLRETDSMAEVKVEDIMSKDVTTVSSNMTVSELLTIMTSKTYVGYPVINDKNELVGIVTIEEVAKVDKDSRWKTKVGSIARQNIDVSYPGETALDIIRKMRKQETGRVIVLDPKDPKKILGIVTKRDLMYVLIKQAAESALS
jgi:coenzyme F420 hydrogenase subunit beta